MIQWLQAALAAFPLFLAALPVLAAPAAGEAQDHYRRCLSQAENQPDKAAAEAAGWKQAGGGAAARHCQAVALFNDGQYADAAARFTELSDDIAAGRARLDNGVHAAMMAARLRDQAGESWLQARDFPKAVAAWDAALATRGLPDDAPGKTLRAALLTGRGRGLAAGGRYADAIRDFTAAEALDASRADLYLYRASARRLYGDLDAAAADIDKAMKLAPNDPDMVLEHGNIAHAQGDSLAAAADWSQVIKDAPGSDAADAARANLSGREPEAQY